ncbi:hypothetical protein [Pseudophaeobacter sp. TrK17]|uniref:hypothetical protein n=1 Tax=Pseudophaeobacter sp. TrK17 TaxID=2815167 RepID=UPI0035CFEEE9
MNIADFPAPLVIEKQGCPALSDLAKLQPIACAAAVLFIIMTIGQGNSAQMPGGGRIQGLALFEIRKSGRSQTEICAQANKQFFHSMARLKFFP